MIDSGNNGTLLAKETARYLGIHGEKCQLSMDLAGGKHATEVSELVSVRLSPVTDPGNIIEIDVHTIKKPANGVRTISKRNLRKFSHLESVLKNLHLSGGNIDLLIGTDLSVAFIDHETLTGKLGDPIAKRNIFGWTLLGRIDKNTDIVPSACHIRRVEVEITNDLETDMKKLLMQDHVGVKPTKLCTCSEAELKENRFIKMTTQSTELVEDRIRVGMPWGEGGPPTQSNYDLALDRLIAKEKQLQRNNRLELVNSEVKKLVELNFVKTIPNYEVNHEEPERYLPLLEVLTPGKSTEVRIVFDASAKDKDNKSLNDYLEKGPGYVNLLLDVLVAWRWDEVAFCGDIRKMFNQVLLATNDQRFHRFLWRDGNGDMEPTVYQWTRLNFGDKPAPDLATNCINTLAKLNQTVYPESSSVLLRQAYVDDIAGSESTPDRVRVVTSGINDILKKGSFEIKAWHSNSGEIDKTDEPVTTVLGHSWNKYKDSFKLKGTIHDLQNVATLVKSKRKCLMITAQTWDPLGLSLPCSIKLRIDLQELWALGYDWDDILPDSFEQKWTENVSIVNSILEMDFPRRLKPLGAIGNPQIHCFADAGTLAYGGVIFLRWQLSTDNFCLVPVMIKAYVAPLKTKSIPRLELTACVVVVRMLSEVKRILKTVVQFGKCENLLTFVWSDSTTVISWVNSPPREFKPYVSSRIAEIQETINGDIIRYVSSKSNPADALTRGIKPEKLLTWLAGPTFLHVHETQWPDFTRPEFKKEEIEDERKPVKETNKKLHAYVVVTESAAEVAENAENIIPVKSKKKHERDNPILTKLVENCSTFTKVRRTLGYIRRFTSKIKVKNSVLTVRELQEAEQCIFRMCQESMDFKSLQQDKRLEGLDPRQTKFGLWVAHGRLENVRSLPTAMRNPIVLDGKLKVVKLLVEHIHKKIGHCGNKRLVAELRQKFWILGVVSLSKFVVHKCKFCRKMRGKPRDQIMGQLPEMRAESGFCAFTNTGMDMFGPLKIRLNRRTLADAQVIIFCCLTSRAIHLELVTDRSSDTFLMAFKRFADIRGHPAKCWSDRGTNFVGSQAYLREIMKGWDIVKIRTVLAEDFECEFEWEWNVPTASHMNGSVESLIKSVRRTLEAVCKGVTHTEEEWRTILTGIAYIVNSRPLYPSSPEIWDCPPVTPNDLLIGHHVKPPQPGLVDRVNPRHLIRSVENRVGQFWKCWMTYFAPELLLRHKWWHPRDNIEIGDLVLEVDPHHKRLQWSMAVVTDVQVGPDDKVRKVTIKNKDGIYQRPIQKLCLIATRQELESNI